MLKTALISCLAVCLVACSRVEITRITDATCKDGLRFYRSEPYLLVTDVSAGSEKSEPQPSPGPGTVSKKSEPQPSPGPGTVSKKQTSVIYLPNKSQEYVVRISSGLGATELAATLEGGWNLTQLGTKVDTKVPEIITALTGAPWWGGGGAALRTTLPLDPGLYRIKFDPHTGAVSGLEMITLPKQSQK